MARTDVLLAPKQQLPQQMPRTGVLHQLAPISNSNRMRNICRNGARSEADLAQCGALALPPPFLFLWLFVQIFSTPPYCGKICGSGKADLNVGRRPRARARRLRSMAGSNNSGRHILESRCAEPCTNDEFSTSFRATLIFISAVDRVSSGSNSTPGRKTDTLRLACDSSWARSRGDFPFFFFTLTQKLTTV